VQLELALLAALGSGERELLIHALHYPPFKQRISLCGRPEFPPEHLTCSPSPNWAAGNGSPFLNEFLNEL